MNLLHDLGSLPPWALWSFTFLLGLTIGSFLNVVVYRLPEILARQWRRDCADLNGTEAIDDGAPLSLAQPDSRCPHCGHAIRAWENIPVLSYLWLRGRCSACAAPIGWRYPAVELITATLSVVVVVHYGISVQAAAMLVLTWALLALTFIDFDHHLLPDVIVLPVLWLGLILNLGGVFAPLPAAVIGAITGYLALWFVFQAFRMVTGKEGMGYGDFKLLALFGAWHGWTLLPLTILLASLVGAIIGITLIVSRRQERSQPIPFGPYLCLGGWISLLWGDRIVRSYLQLAGFG